MKLVKHGRDEILFFKDEILFSRTPAAEVKYLNKSCTSCMEKMNNYFGKNFFIINWFDNIVMIGCMKIFIFVHLLASDL